MLKNRGLASKGARVTGATGCRAETQKQTLVKKQQKKAIQMDHTHIKKHHPPAK